MKRNQSIPCFDFPVYLSQVTGEVLKGLKEFNLLFEFYIIDNNVEHHDGPDVRHTDRKSFEEAYNFLRGEAQAIYSLKLDIKVQIYKCL